MTNEHASDETLAARLRELPTQRTPPEAVWTAIAADIAAPAADPITAAAPVVALSSRQRPRWRAPLAWAMAASVALLAVLLMPRQAPTPDPVAVTSAPPSTAVLVHQADAMAGEYRQAIASLPTTEVPADLRPALHELDASAAAIRVALGQQPDAEFLLNQLRRTYAKRLELTRMAALETPAPTTT